MRSVPERGSVGSTVAFRPWMRSVPERGSVGSTVEFRPWMRSVPERGSVGSTVEFEAFVRNRSEEPQTFAHDVGRYLVVAVELSKRDVVTASFQARSDEAAAAVNRQDMVPRAV